MKIISDFRDYYDTALALGFDDSVHYKRKTQTMKGTAPAYNDPHGPWRGLSSHMEALARWASGCASVNTFETKKKNNPDPQGRLISCAPLAFCIGSKPIKALWLTIAEPSKDESDDRLDDGPKWLNWRADENNNIPPKRIIPAGYMQVFDGPIFTTVALRDKLSPWINKAIEDKKRGKTTSLNLSHYSWTHDHMAIHRGLLGQYKWIGQNDPPQNLIALMAENNSVCTAANSHGFCIENPRLADCQIFRTLDPQSCMQEVSMAVANLASPELDDTPVADIHKVAAHGFDQASFRKQPTKGASPARQKRPHPDKR